MTIRTMNAITVKEIPVVRELNVDLGNMELKGCGFNENDELILKTLHNKILAGSEDTLSPDARLLEVFGRKLWIGEGSPNNNVAKYDREFLEEQVLAMACEVYPSDDILRIDLKLGLPPAQYKEISYRDKLISKFKINEEYNFKIRNNGKWINKTLIINTVDVKIEGYSAFISISEDVQYQGRDILALDIGGNTSDAIRFAWSHKYGQFVANTPYTVEKGQIDMISDIQQKINSINGADISADKIDEGILYDVNEIPYGDYNYKISDYICAANDTAEMIINQIQNKFGSLDNYEVCLFGGGHKLFNKLKHDKIRHQIDICDADRFYANCIGYSMQ